MLKKTSSWLKDINVPVLDEATLASLFGGGHSAWSAKDKQGMGKDALDGDKKLRRLGIAMEQMELSGGRRKGKKSSTTSDEARTFLHDVYEYLGLISNAAIG